MCVATKALSVPSFTIFFSNQGDSILSFPFNPPTSPDRGEENFLVTTSHCLGKTLFPSTSMLRKLKLRESNLKLKGFSL